VSFSDRETEDRLVREGYWHFDPADADLPRDLVQATVMSMQECPEVAAGLERLKIGVSFLGPFESIGPADLDYGRYGIAVRSRIYPKTGGALPNTQAFTSEYEQYLHARFTNARVTLFEPHDLYRYTVTKHVEPGERWLPYGSEETRTWMTDPEIGTRLLARSREILAGRTDGDPLPDDLIPDPLHGVAVTLWHRGVAGCRVAWEGSLDDCVTRATRGALDDDRFPERLAGATADDLAISVSLLHDPEHMGEQRRRTLHKLRRGVDSLAVRRGERMGMLLSYVAVHENLDKDAFGATALRKAQIGNDETARWTTLQTATWIESGGRAAPLSFGFPRRTTPLDRADALPLLTSYIARHLGADGLPEYCYFPLNGEVLEKGTAARVIHAARVLALAARALGDARLERTARDGIAGIVERVSRTGGLGVGDHEVVRALFHRDGAIGPHLPGRQTGADHDYLPGAAILALSQYAAATDDVSLLANIGAAFTWYARRFRLVHPWGMVGWHPQAWSIVHALAPRPEYAELIFEMADWAIHFQHRASGAFLTDLDPTGPSFHTGFLGEGIAAAWKLARAHGDERQGAYAESAENAWKFVQQLVVTQEDTFCMPDPERSRGGVRGSRLTSYVRIDFVSHVLEMLIRIAEAERTAPAQTIPVAGTRGAMR
jgi:AMMECR1 domain-containing protein